MTTIEPEIEGITPKNGMKCVSFNNLMFKLLYFCLFQNYLMMTLKSESDAKGHSNSQNQEPMNFTDGSTIKIDIRKKLLNNMSLGVL